MSVSVYIEIEKNSNLKYEFNKEKGDIILDRKLLYPFFYPYSYGFIPNTLSEDGDELDVLVVSETKFPSKSFIHCKIIGALLMRDEKGKDEKIIMVPSNEYISGMEIFQLDPMILKNIEWFFDSYKSMDSDRWSKIEKFVSSSDAKQLYIESIQRYIMHNDIIPNISVDII